MNKILKWILRIAMVEFVLFVVSCGLSYAMTQDYIAVPTNMIVMNFGFLCYQLVECIIGLMDD